MDRLARQSLHSVLFDEDGSDAGSNVVPAKVIIETYNSMFPEPPPIKVSEKEITSILPSVITKSKDSKLYLICSGRPLKLTEASETILLEIASAGKKGITQSELAKRLKLDPRSLFHLLKTIIDFSLITKTPISRNKTFTHLLKLSILSDPSDVTNALGDGDFVAADDHEMDEEEETAATAATNGMAIQPLYLSKGIEQQVIEYVEQNYSYGCTLTDLMVPFSMNRKMMYRLIERLTSIKPHPPLLKKSELVGKAKQHRIFPAVIASNLNSSNTTIDNYRNNINNNINNNYTTTNSTITTEQQKVLRGSTIQQEGRLRELLEILTSSDWVESSRSLIDLLQERLGENSNTSGGGGGAGGHLMDTKTMKRLIERLEGEGELRRVVIDSNRTLLVRPSILEKTEKVDSQSQSQPQSDSEIQSQPQSESQPYIKYLKGIPFTRKVTGDKAVYGEIRKMMLLHRYIHSLQKTNHATEEFFSSIPDALLEDLLRDGREESGMCRIISLLLQNKIIKPDRRYPSMPNGIPYRFDYVFAAAPSTATTFTTTIEDVDAFYEEMRKEIGNLSRRHRHSFYFSSPNEPVFRGALRSLQKSPDLINDFCEKFQIFKEDAEYELSTLPPLPSEESTTLRLLRRRRRSSRSLSHNKRRRILPKHLSESGSDNDSESGSESDISSTGSTEDLEERIGNSINLSSKLDDHQVRIVHLLFEILQHPINRLNTLQWTLLETILPSPLSALLGTTPTLEELRVFCQRMVMLQWCPLLQPHNPISYKVKKVLAFEDESISFKDQFDLLMFECFGVCLCDGCFGCNGLSGYSSCNGFSSCTRNSNYNNKSINNSNSNSNSNNSNKNKNNGKVFLEEGEWELKDRLAMFRRLAPVNQWKAFCLLTEGMPGLLLEEQQEQPVFKGILKRRKELCVMDPLLMGDNIPRLLEDIVNGPSGDGDGDGYVVESNGKVYM